MTVKALKYGIDLALSRQPAKEQGGSETTPQTVARLFDARLPRTRELFDILRSVDP
jgi:hypothetical protein